MKVQQQWIAGAIVALTLVFLFACNSNGDVAASLRKQGAAILCDGRAFLVFGSLLRNTANTDTASSQSASLFETLHLSYLLKSSWTSISWRPFSKWRD